MPFEAISGRILDLPTSSCLSTPTFRDVFKIIFPEITPPSEEWRSVARGIKFDPAAPLSFRSTGHKKIGSRLLASPDLGQLVRFWNSFSLLVDAFLFALDELVIYARMRRALG